MSNVEASFGNEVWKNCLKVKDIFDKVFNLLSKHFTQYANSEFPYAKINYHTFKNINSKQWLYPNHYSLGTWRFVRFQNLLRKFFWNILIQIESFVLHDIFNFEYITYMNIIRLNDNFQTCDQSNINMYQLLTNYFEQFKQYYIIYIYFTLTHSTFYIPSLKPSITRLSKRHFY